MTSLSSFPSGSGDSPPHEVVVVRAVRTPLCRARKGGLSGVPPATLLTAALKGCLGLSTSEKDGGNRKAQPILPPTDVQEVCVGNVLCPASGFAAMRMAAASAGLTPSEVPLHTLNRQCSSGLQAVAQVANAIAMGEIEVGIGAGVESMSVHPMTEIEPPTVDYDAMKATPEAMDCLIPMGITSENVAKKYGLSRRDLDEFALRSHEKAEDARRLGKFAAEIVPVNGVMHDDGIRVGTTMEALGKLKPAFDKKNGTTTAGNSSQVTDGAAAVLLMSRAEAQRRNLPILGVWKGFVVRAVPPKIMGIGPAYAIPALLEKFGLSKEDIDVYEINEAFASQVTWCISELGLDTDKVNPNGGAIALGHPLGCTGARQVATLLNELHRRPKKTKKLGVVSMCVGTGMGAAALLEVQDELHEAPSWQVPSKL